MVSVLIVVAAACAFGVAASLILNWSSGKSAMWNAGFAVIIVLGSTALLLIAVVLLMRQLSR